MITMENAPRLFDVALADNPFSPYIPIRRPTKRSVKRINSHFGITLPSSMTEFAQSSKKYRSWFCSIGDDFQDRNHIIRATSLYRKMRRRIKRRWHYRMPRSFIVIRSGHDDHNLCLDRADYDSSAGEYRLQYWFPGYENEFGDSYDSFKAYIKSLIRSLIENSPSDVQKECYRIMRQNSVTGNAEPYTNLLK